MTDFLKIVKSPRFLGGFFIVLAIFLLNNVSYADNNKELSVWVITDNKEMCENYLQEINSDTKFYSNWLSAFYVTLDSDNIKELKGKSFVTAIQYASKLSIPQLDFNGIELQKALVDENNVWFNNFSDSHYKQYLLSKQIHLLHYFNLEDLPKVKVGLIDGGFDTTSDFFKSINVIENRNFTDELSTIEYDSHGTSVLGLLGGNSAGVVTTAGKHCDFYLAKTEVSESERLVEEYYLLAALEWLVDTVGVELINISLGYNTFDVPSENHTVDELNGDSTIAAKAVNKAFKRGASVFTSAGNEATHSWKYITTPADAKGALAIGSVTYSGDRSPFSSFGIEEYGIKPDVMDIGSDVTIYSNTGNNLFATSNGTSLASPIALGTAILLKRLNPTMTNIQLYSRFRQSGNNSSTPDHEYGYGIINSLKIVSDSTTIAGFVYDNNIPVNNCKVIIGTDSIFTKSDGFWFYKNNALKETHTISFVKKGYNKLLKMVESGSIDSSVIVSAGKSVNITLSSYKRLIAQYEIIGKEFSYIDYSNYNGEYKLDTNGVISVIQKTFFADDSNIVTINAPFSDTTVEINSKGYFARISFLQSDIGQSRYLDDLDVTVNSDNGIFDYVTDDYGSIFISSEDIGDKFSVSITSKKYYGANSSYKFDSHIADTIYTSVNPTIYPNPLINANRIYINYNNIISYNKSAIDFVKMFTSLGKRVSSIEVDYDIEENRFIINFHGLAAGVYYIKVEENMYKFLYIK